MFRVEIEKHRDVILLLEPGPDFVGELLVLAAVRNEDRTHGTLFLWKRQPPLPFFPVCRFALVSRIVGLSVLHSYDGNSCRVDADAHHASPSTTKPAQLT